MSKKEWEFVKEKSVCPVCKNKCKIVSSAYGTGNKDTQYTINCRDHGYYYFTVTQT